MRLSQNRDEPLIKLNNVWKIYRMGDVDFAALKAITMDIYEGEFLVVLGPSGSGKSTLMNLIGCLDLPSKGEVFLDSKDISGLGESELARIRGQMIGFIFQSFNLIPTLNTQENVLLPMEFQEEDVQIARKRSAYLLEIVGLSDKKQNLPSQLSGGQRQRVAIARSLAVNPPIILADEPTGNLDSKTGGYILEFLSKLHENEGKTIIVVTHDLEIIKHATRVVYLKDGEIEKIEERKKNRIGGARMKTFSFLTLLLLSTVFICLGTGTALGSNGMIDSSSVQVNLSNQNPNTARPGEPVELTLSVQNVGNNDLKDITVKIDQGYPFSQLSGESLQKSVSYLNARQDNSDAAVLKFKLMIDANASEGTYDIDVTTTSKESESHQNRLLL